MRIIENFLPEETVTQIRETLTNNYFKWYYHDATSDYSPDRFEDANTVDSIQFTHSMFKDNEAMSEHIQLIMKIAKGLEAEGVVIKELYRAKANMLPRDPTYVDGTYHYPHSDTMLRYEDNTYSFIYYVNDSDGDTFIFNESTTDFPDTLTVAHRITPKAGTGVLFKSNTYHASSSPKVTNSRFVINIVFDLG